MCCTGQMGPAADDARAGVLDIEQDSPPDGSDRPRDVVRDEDRDTPDDARGEDGDFEIADEPDSHADDVRPDDDPSIDSPRDPTDDPDTDASIPGSAPTFCGDGDPGRYQFELSGECTVYAAFDGPIPLCCPDQETPIDWDAPPGGLSAEPVPPSSVELQCSLARGCPELVGGWRIPLADVLDYAQFGASHLQPDGSLVLQSFIGPHLLHMSRRDGLLAYDETDVATPTMIGIPGSTDVLTFHNDLTMSWYGATGRDEDPDTPRPDDWCHDRGVCYGQYISRRRPDGGFVWSQPVLLYTGGGPMSVFPDIDSVFVTADPDNCRFRGSCPRYRARLSLDTGELQNCLPEEWTAVSAQGTATLGPSTTLSSHVGGFLITDELTGESVRVALDPDELGDPLRLAPLSDGTLIAGTTHGIVHFTLDGTVLARDEWFDSPVSGTFFGPPAVSYGDRIVWPTRDGLVRFGPESIATRDYTLQYGFTVGSDVTVAQDGTVFVADTRGVTAFPDAVTGEPLWSIRNTEGSTWAAARVILLGDMMAITNLAGGITWWRHVHGDLANTPLPEPGWVGRRLREGPFDESPEVDIAWQR